ncbi:MAG: hypothetical protein WCS67_01610 [Bacteroidales bacterium]
MENSIRVLSALLLTVVAAPVMAIIVVATFVLVLPAICAEAYNVILHWLPSAKTNEEKIK